MEAVFTYSVSIRCAAIQHDVLGDEIPSIKIRYRTDSRLFNLQRLQAEAKVEEDSVHDFLFTDVLHAEAFGNVLFEDNIIVFCKALSVTFYEERSQGKLEIHVEQGGQGLCMKFI
ncbi:hypothetical protein NDU88_004902 [Pleurodeles waltl]|uniref:Uncharacterized protein n=1 Tax=Pleurodeles waltl TaxID=8319 RepID=A0AAV7TTA0_PLEWA|nr:hypothetical protein NDU88_004902 [Pleurodeles waltl]